MKPVPRFWIAGYNQISPYIREGSGLKLKTANLANRVGLISPYIREGSGLKLIEVTKWRGGREDLPLHP